MELIKNKNKLLLLISLFVFSQNVLSEVFIQQQKYVLNHATSQSNIIGQSIQTIYQDKYGIFWLGVESVGLLKYYGKSSTIYKYNSYDDSSISNNYIHKIIEDDTWYLWIATANGLNRLDRRKEVFKRYFHKEDTNSLSNNLINDIVKDKFGNLWIATANGISILNPNTEQFIRLYDNTNENKPERNNFIHSICIEESGDVWVGTSLYGMLKINANCASVLENEWNDNIISTFLSESKAPLLWELEDSNYVDKDILNIVSNNSDTLWISGVDGLYYFVKSLDKFKKVYFPKYGTRFLNNTTFNSLLIDSKNVLWAGTVNNGIVVIDLNEDDVYPYHISALNYAANGLISGYIYDIIEAESGLIWFATKFEGLHFYDRNQGKFPILKRGSKLSQGLSSDDVTAILEVGETIWFGTSINGITIYDEKNNTFENLKRSFNDDGLPSNKILSLAKDNVSNVWIGTDKGLTKNNIVNNSFEQYLDMPIIAITQISDDVLWLGTRNGIYHFSISKKKIINVSSKHPEFFNQKNNVEVLKILKDDNIVYIATNTTGLFEYYLDKDSLVNYTNNPKDELSIGSNQINSIFVDKSEKIWIGTKSAGLYLFEKDSNQFIKKTSSNQIPSNSVFQILEDNRGQLWLGTGDGIVQYNPWTEEFVSFSNVKGLQNTVFDANVACKIKSGIMLMGGSRGVNVFNPNNTSVSGFNFPMIISSITHGNNTLVVDLDSSSHIFEFKDIKKPINFEFALLDYSNLERNIYKYILEPFDNEWIEAGARSSASYVNLPAGKYTFKVVGENEGGMSGGKAAEVTFIIPTPFWATVWFKIAAGISVLVVLIFIYHLKILHGKQREKELKKLVKQKTVDLSKANKKLSEFNKEINERNVNLVKQRDKIRLQNLELEMHRNQLEEMVYIRTKDLELEKVKAQESDRLKSAFLANMSHEIRTPLNAIMGFIDLLQAGIFHEDEKIEIGNIIYQNSNDLLQLVNDIIDISIIESNQLTIQKSEVSFNEFLKDIKRTYLVNQTLVQKRLSLELEMPEEEIIVITDKSRVQQIFSNLLNNAIKFTDKGVVKFGCKVNSEKNRLECYVCDTGIGITEDHQKILFKRFTKIEPTFDKVHRGAGLGLSISKNLANLLGGGISLKSEKGKGSTFCFWLPL